MSSYYDTVAGMIDSQGYDTVAKVEIIGAVKARVRHYLTTIERRVVRTQRQKFAEYKAAITVLLAHTGYEDPELYLQDLHTMAHDLGNLRLKDRYAAGFFGDNPYWRGDDRSVMP